VVPVIFASTATMGRRESLASWLGDEESGFVRRAHEYVALEHPDFCLADPDRLPRRGL